MKRRILFIGSKPLGDTICAIGLLQHVIARMPHARVTIVVKNNATEEIFTAIPEIDTVIPLYKGKSKGFFKILKFLISRYWEILIISNVHVCRRAAIFRALGLFSWRVKYCLLPAPFKKLNTVSRPRYMASAVNRIDQSFLGPCLEIASKHKEEAKKILPEDNRALTLSPFAGNIARSWPVDYFCTLIQKLTQEGVMKDAPIVILGTVAQRKDISHFVHYLPHHRIIPLMGDTHMMTIAACMARSRLFITNDSGLMHVASLTLKKPFISIFSSAGREGWHWSDYNHSIESGKFSIDWSSYRDHPRIISVDTVYRASLEILKKGASPYEKKGR